MTDKQSHPPAFWFIFWGEFAERCSFYGMRAILPLYLTSVLGFPDTEAGSIYSTFKMAVYFLPLLGGFLADRYFGKYWSIVGFSVPYVLGHFILGIETQVSLVIALTLLAIGSGITKPNISTLMGMTYDQRRPGQEELLSAAFRWFYFSINVGALISIFALPMVRDYYAAKYERGMDVVDEQTKQHALAAAYRIAFLVPTLFMTGALIVFAAGKRFYAVETPGRSTATPEQRRQQWETLKTLLGVFALIAFFWFAYEHNDGIWVYFIRDYVDRTLPGIDRLTASVDWLAQTPLAFIADSLKPQLAIIKANGVAPDQIQFLNALFVLIFVPTLSAIVRLFDPKQRILTAAIRILIGFLATAAAVSIMSAAGFATQSGNFRVPLYWVALAYIMLTLGEVLVYGTGLELSYTAAPTSMKGFITACFLVTNTLGNLINVGFLRLYGGSLKDEAAHRGPLLPGPFFALTALIVLAATVAFYFVGRRLTRQQELARQSLGGT